MRIFISWSGALSNALASEFRRWLPRTIQTVRPYFTPTDVEKGARWSAEIASELEASDIGVLFVTPENLSSAWLLFEAGALSKRLGPSKVCPILFNVGTSDLPGPLQQFQATEFSRDDFTRLLRTINISAGESSLADPDLDEVIATWWPQLEARLTQILEANPRNGPIAPSKTTKEVLDELVALARENLRTSEKIAASTPGAVSSGAISAIVEHLKEAVDYARQKNITESLDSMKKISSPLEHIIRQSISGSRGPELRRRLHQISFELNIDDEIPF